MGEIFGLDLRAKLTSLSQFSTWLWIVSGMFLIVGLVIPALNYLFYLAFVYPAWTAYTKTVTRSGMFWFWLPYTSVVGLGIWSKVFPMYSGILLAFMLTFLLGNLFWLLLTRVRMAGGSMLLWPLGLFVFEFLFHSVPGLFFVELPLTMGIVSNHLWVVRSALLVGSSLTLFLTALAVSLVAVMVIERKITPGKIAAFALCVSIPVLSNILVGTSASGQGVRIVAVHGNVTQLAADLRGEEYLDYVYGAFSSAIEDAAGDIFLFPEVPLGIYYPANPDYRGDKFVELAAAKNAYVLPLVLEYRQRNDEDLDQYLTTLVVNSGGVVGQTSKRNLVPFSEARINRPGKDYSAINTAHGRVGISICYDINSPVTLARLKKDGAQLILAPFNDSGFGTIFHRIHSHYPVLRALEYNLPIVVANEAGVSRIIDRNGRVLDGKSGSDQGWIGARLEMTDTPGYYQRFGFFAELIALALMVAVLVSNLQARLRVRSSA